MSVRFFWRGKQSDGVEVFWEGCYPCAGDAEPGEIDVLSAELELFGVDDAPFANGFEEVDGSPPVSL